MVGRHRGPHRGSSVEFAEHREYCPGDDFRHIDWRAVGKTGRWFIREFEEETTLRAWLFVDASGSMNYAGQAPRKFDYARITAAALAWLFIGQRDAVGLTTFGTSVCSERPPSSSRTAFQDITRILKETEPGGQMGLQEALQQQLPAIRRRSLLVLVSDCLEPLDHIETALQQGRHAGHELVLFRIAAPDEVTFPFRTPARFHSLEQTSRDVLVDPARLRQEYLRQYREFCERLEQICGNLSVDYLPLVTTDPLQDRLRFWLDRRLRHPGR